jgi:hypothetical protein
LVGDGVPLSTASFKAFSGVDVCDSSKIMPDSAFEKS